MWNSVLIGEGCNALDGPEAYLVDRVKASWSIVTGKVGDTTPIPPSSLGEVHWDWREGNHSWDWQVGNTHSVCDGLKLADMCMGRVGAPSPWSGESGVCTWDRQCPPRSGMQACHGIVHTSHPSVAEHPLHVSPSSITGVEGDPEVLQKQKEKSFTPQTLAVPCIDEA